MLLKRLGFGGAMCAAVLSPLSCGCGATHDYGCSTSVDPGLIVYITDAATGAPAAADATVNVTDGSYSETLQSPLTSGDGTNIPLGFAGAYERAGTYTVHISRNGYIPEERTVRVTKGDCHVNTQEVTVALMMQ